MAKEATVKIPSDVVTPLFFYLAVTIGVPLFGGSGRDPEFRAHAVTVFSVASALVSLRMFAGARLTKQRPDAIERSDAAR
jgi:hypothetical protein